MYERPLLSDLDMLYVYVVYICCMYAQLHVHMQSYVPSVVCAIFRVSEPVTGVSTL
jgi:hypothetical protein